MSMEIVIETLKCLAGLARGVNCNYKIFAIIFFSFPKALFLYLRAGWLIYCQYISASHYDLQLTAKRRLFIPFQASCFREKVRDKRRRKRKTKGPVSKHLGENAS